MFIVFVSVTVAHGAFPSTVRVNKTFPAAISAMLGVYVQVVNEFELVKVPVPFDVQVVEVKLEAFEPIEMFTSPSIAQVFIAGPATAVGIELIVIVLVDEASVQEPFEEVNVKITDPAVISSALGI